MAVTSILIESDLRQSQSLHEYARSTEAKLAVTSLLLSPNIHIDCDLQSSISNIWIQYQPREANSDQISHPNVITPAHNADSIEMDWSAHNVFADHNLHQRYTQGSDNNPQPMVDFTSDSRLLDDCAQTTSGTPQPCSTPLPVLDDSTIYNKTPCATPAVPSLEATPTRDREIPIEDMGNYTGGDKHPDDCIAAASYPTPVSNPSHTPRLTNGAIRKKGRKSAKGKVRQARGNHSASTPAKPTELISSGISCNDGPTGDGQLSLSDESKTMRLDLLRSLAGDQHFDDKKLCEIYQTGDRIIRDTVTALDDWRGWILKDFEQYGLLLPSCHDLPPADICTSMFRFLIQTNNDKQRKSVYRRLARVLFFVFLSNYGKQLKQREDNGEFIDHNHRDLTAIAHASILRMADDLTLKDEEYGLSQISDSKSYGKRWWRLGSGIGIIVILTCGPDVTKYIETRSFPDKSLKLLVDYMINAYSNAIAHFQSLNPVIQPFLADASLFTNHFVDWNDHIDPLHLQFNVLPETQRVDTDTAIDNATENLLQYFGHCD